MEDRQKKQNELLFRDGNTNDIIGFMATKQLTSKINPQTLPLCFCNVKHPFHSTI